MAKPVMLIVLDGWGIGAQDSGNPLARASLPTFEKIAATYPVTSLEASGIAVGLPWGEVGNSEVGHLTLGAGRVLYQHYPRITLAIQEGRLAALPALAAVRETLERSGGRLHLAGLLSSGHVHAAIEHATALLSWAQVSGIGERTYVHAFGDGVDSPTRSMEDLLARLPNARLASAVGRHYAMNRDESWQLTEGAYGCMTGRGTPAPLHERLEALYARSLGEEFLEPTLIDPEGAVREGDVVLFWNFREDGIEQLARCFAAPGTAGFPVPSLGARVATLTAYDDAWDVDVLFPEEQIENPLGRVIADAGLAQLRVAETYKHAHVTSFFNGYRQEPFANEYRVLIPSLASPRPQEHPELVASQITDRLELAAGERSFPFVLANYANADVIGHTGDFRAAIKAAECVDAQLARLLPYAERGELSLIITADHGNIERMLDPLTGRAETVHDKSPVPLYLVDASLAGKRFANQERLREHVGGTLADVAPTVLALMGVPQPASMTGVNLLMQLY